MRARKGSKNLPKKFSFPKFEIKPIKFPNLIPFFRGVFIAMIVVSMALWIFLGSIFSIFIIQVARQGSLEKLLTARTQQTNQVEQQARPQQQTQQQPAEANIPGVGKVNINCVKGALSDEAIRKVIVAGNTSVLSAEEKTRFEPCITAK